MHKHHITVGSIFKERRLIYQERGTFGGNDNARAESRKNILNIANRMSKQQRERESQNSSEQQQVMNPTPERLEDTPLKPRIKRMLTKLREATNQDNHPIIDLMKSSDSFSEEQLQYEISNLLHGGGSCNCPEGHGQYKFRFTETVNGVEGIGIEERVEDRVHKSGKSSRRYVNRFIAPLPHYNQIIKAKEAARHKKRAAEEQQRLNDYNSAVKAGQARYRPIEAGMPALHKLMTTDYDTMENGHEHFLRDLQAEKQNLNRRKAKGGRLTMGDRMKSIMDTRFDEVNKKDAQERIQQKIENEYTYAAQQFSKMGYQVEWQGEDLFIKGLDNGKMINMGRISAYPKDANHPTFVDRGGFQGRAFSDEVNFTYNDLRNVGLKFDDQANIIPGSGQAIKYNSLNELTAALRPQVVAMQPITIEPDVVMPNIYQQYQSAPTPQFTPQQQPTPAPQADPYTPENGFFPAPGLDSHGDAPGEINDGNLPENDSDSMQSVIETGANVNKQTAPVLKNDDTGQSILEPVDELSTKPEANVTPEPGGFQELEQSQEADGEKPQEPKPSKLDDIGLLPFDDSEAGEVEENLFPILEGPEPSGPSKTKIAPETFSGPPPLAQKLDRQSFENNGSEISQDQLATLANNLKKQEVIVVDEKGSLNVDGAAVVEKVRNRPEPTLLERFIAFINELQGNAPKQKEVAKTENDNEEEGTDGDLVEKQKNKIPKIGPFKNLDFKNKDEIRKAIKDMNPAEMMEELFEGVEEKELNGGINRIKNFCLAVAPASEHAKIEREFNNLFNVLRNHSKIMFEYFKYIDKLVHGENTQEELLVLNKSLRAMNTVQERKILMSLLEGFGEGFEEAVGQEREMQIYKMNYEGNGRRGGIYKFNKNVNGAKRSVVFNVHAATVTEE